MLGGVSQASGREQAEPLACAHRAVSLTWQKVVWGSPNHDQD